MHLQRFLRKGQFMVRNWRVGFAVLALAACAVVGGSGAGSASAAAMTTACGNQLFEQPFLRWLDPLNYVLAPDGGLEAGASGWKLSGAAKVTSGNEPFRVRGAADLRSLSLPSGSSATTPPMCVGVDAVVARLFAANSGSLLSTLKVEVIHRNLLGLTVTTPVAVLAGTPGWQPTLPLAVLANVASLNVLLNQTTEVSLRFTPLGSSSGWKIDDVYVDPFKGF
jgi:hypothetical protein